MKSPLFARTQAERDHLKAKKTINGSEGARKVLRQHRNVVAAQRSRQQQKQNAIKAFAMVDILSEQNRQLRTRCTELFRMVAKTNSVNRRLVDFALATQSISEVAAMVDSDDYNLFCDDNSSIHFRQSFGVNPGVSIHDVSTGH